VDRLIFIILFIYELNAHAAFSSSLQILDTNGNTIDSSTTTPVGTERGLICRSIPSGVQAVTSATLPLPSGASTSANQTTELSTLATIAANTAVTTVTQTTGSNLHTVVDSGIVTANIGTTNGIALDSSVNTLLKPASTLAAVTSLSQFNGVPISLNTGVRDTGTLRVSIATNDIVPVSQSTLPWIISGAAAVGSAPIYNPVSISGVDAGGLKRIFKTDSTGTLLISKVDGTKKTYSASVINFILPTTPTDVLTITGSATATVKINKMGIVCNQTTGSYQDLVLVRRSTANTGGTATTLTNTPTDPLSTTATATVRSYSTTNPTLGTLVGNLRATKIAIPTAVLQQGGGNNSTIASGADFNLSASDMSQAFTLRGVSQVLAINFNGQTMNGASCSGYVEFTEE